MILPAEAYNRSFSQNDIKKRKSNLTKNLGDDNLFLSVNNIPEKRLTCYRIFPVLFVNYSSLFIILPAGFQVSTRREKSFTDTWNTVFTRK